MAPIYDTDIAEERWTSDVWKSYELWEKVELRFKRKRRLWITGAAIAFVLLSSIPVMQDSLPKWRSLGATRRLATVLGDARLRAARERQPVRISLETRDGEVLYRMDRVKSCDAAAGEVVAEGPVFDSPMKGEYEFLPQQVAAQQGIPGIVSTYCHDPYGTPPAVPAEDKLLAFALLPVKDLAEVRFDRMSMVLVDPVSGAATIE